VVSVTMNGLYLFRTRRRKSMASDLIKHIPTPASRPTCSNRPPRSGGLLGRMVRPLQDDRPHP
jgi:hypothetical protein